MGYTIRRSFPELYKRLKEWVVLPQDELGVLASTNKFKKSGGVCHIVKL
jgi:hypothetical protein